MSHCRFPQELDEEYLVIWDGFSNPPWKSMSEDELRRWLRDRGSEGYSFPLNPKWVLCDAGWYDLLRKLLESEGARNSANATS